MWDFDNDVFKPGCCPIPYQLALKLRPFLPPAFQQRVPTERALPPNSTHADTLLPPELWQKILGYCSSRDRYIMASSVCKNFRDIFGYHRVPVNWYITFKPGCDPNTGMFPFKLEIADRGMDCIPVVIPDELLMMLYPLDGRIYTDTDAIRIGDLQFQSDSEGESGVARFFRTIVATVNNQGVFSSGFMKSENFYNDDGDPTQFDMNIEDIQPFLSQCDVRFIRVDVGVIVEYESRTTEKSDLLLQVFDFLLSHNVCLEKVEKMMFCVEGDEFRSRPAFQMLQNLELSDRFEMHVNMDWDKPERLYHNLHVWNSPSTELLRMHEYRDAIPQIPGPAKLLLSGKYMSGVRRRLQEGEVQALIDSISIEDYISKMACIAKEEQEEADRIVTSVGIEVAVPRVKINFVDPY